MALVGGASVLLLPDWYIGFSRMGMLSPDGRCKAFDARADENSSAPHWTGGKQRHAEADEHCLIALVMRASFDSWKGSEARAPIVRENIALAERDRTAPEAAISRILLAPKHSPPV